MSKQILHFDASNVLWEEQPQASYPCPPEMHEQRAESRNALALHPLDWNPNQGQWTEYQEGSLYQPYALPKMYQQWGPKIVYVVSSPQWKGEAVGGLTVGILSLCIWTIPCLVFLLTVASMTSMSNYTNLGLSIFLCLGLLISVTFSILGIVFSVGGYHYDNQGSKARVGLALSVIALILPILLFFIPR